jgi:hypothetical protein
MGGKEVIGRRTKTCGETDMKEDGTDRRRSMKGGRTEKERKRKRAAVVCVESGIAEM